MVLPGKNKQMLKITLRLYRSLGGYTVMEESELEELTYLVAGDYVYGDPIEPYTGDKQVPIAAYIDTDGQFYIKRDKPVPLVVLAAIVEYKLVEESR